MQPKAIYATFPLFQPLTEMTIYETKATILMFNMAVRNLEEQNIIIKKVKDLHRVGFLPWLFINRLLPDNTISKALRTGN